MQTAVVVVIKNDENKTLLLKRSSEHTLYPNQWCLPGGKVDFLYDPIMPAKSRWESLCEAAYRETKEETGIRPTCLIASNFSFHDDNFTVHGFVAADIFSDKDVIANFPNREHVDFKFFSYDDITRLMIEETGNLTRSVIKHIF